MTQDYLVQRIRESVLRLTYSAEVAQRPTDPVDEAVADARDSVRHLARSRVSAVLRELRAVHGFTYEQVHERTGLTQQLLFDMEYKDRRLTLDELGLLASCYQVSVGDVLGIDLE